MKEKLYTIPVNDAFNTKCECPVCSIYHKLEQEAVEFTMGPSYMEDDIRMETDKIGFCREHMRLIWAQNNKLGLALVTSTHMKKTLSDLKELMKNQSSPKSGLFHKKIENPAVSYIRRLDQSCYICDRIRDSFGRHVFTIFHLWKTDAAFRQTYQDSRGFCMSHYALLTDLAPERLSGNHLQSFLEVTNTIFIQNMERVQEDVSWFINKFDYRYNDEPWKNAKDALPRALTKMNGIVDIDKP